MKKTKRIRQLKARIAELEATVPPTPVPSEPVDPQQVWRDTTATYAQGEGDGWNDVMLRGYL